MHKENVCCGWRRVPGEGAGRREAAPSPRGGWRTWAPIRIREQPHRLGFNCKHTFTEVSARSGIAVPARPLRPSPCGQQRPRAPPQGPSDGRLRLLIPPRAAQSCSGAPAGPAWVQPVVGGEGLLLKDGEMWERRGWGRGYWPPAHYLLMDSLGRTTPDPTPCQLPPLGPSMTSSVPRRGVWLVAASAPLPPDPRGHLWPPQGEPSCSHSHTRSLRTRSAGLGTGDVS